MSTTPASIPELVGPAGEAWRFDLQSIREKTGNKPDAGVVLWLLRIPGAHPLWQYYSLDCIHLRPVPGLGDPVINLPGATHEIFLSAISPDWKADLGAPPMRLAPLNFAAQFIEPGGDSDAQARIFNIVIELVTGKLNPDTDFTSQWIARFGDSNLLDRKNERRDTMVQRGSSIAIIGTGAGITRALIDEMKKEFRLWH